MSTQPLPGFRATQAETFKAFCPLCHQVTRHAYYRPTRKAICLYCYHQAYIAPAFVDPPEKCDEPTQ